MTDRRRHSNSSRFTLLLSLLILLSGCGLDSATTDNGGPSAAVTTTVTVAATPTVTATPMWPTTGPCSHITSQELTQLFHQSFLPPLIQTYAGDVPGENTTVCTYYPTDAQAPDVAKVLFNVFASRADAVSNYQSIHQTATTTNPLHVRDISGVGEAAFYNNFGVPEIDFRQGATIAFVEAGGPFDPTAAFTAVKTLALAIVPYVS